MASAMFRNGRQHWRQISKLAAVAGPAGLPSNIAVRHFASEAGSASGSSGTKWFIGLAGLTGAVWAAEKYGYLGNVLGLPPRASKDGVATNLDYKAIREDIASLLDAEDYDDGSYGPVLVRLAWHSSGTYSKEDGTGGSNGATMRFRPEAEHSANAGLHIARELLEPIKKKYPGISYSDLWTLAGCVAVEEMGGPQINWKPGRSDKIDHKACPEDGRLPDGAKGASHVRDIFYRMGFNDQEIVALSGAHSLGRCHTDRSGFENPWTNSPTTFSNLYFTELLDTKWKKRKWNGPPQYENPSKELMMLETDLSLIKDKSFRKYVELYAKDQDKFFEDFAAAYQKLLHLGVPVNHPGQHAPA
ncbi:TPA: heme peroxidase [Trebouxia sp. C0005]|nr:MAG: cytochrome c peroxidase [Trebouxia sp. A1-2]